ncbi:unnamed protein product [Gongylonema pulchrum]|uniref:CPXV017 protein n=1 Tax=Gongylonema pulchrum TaxID=637853 RepID=A0A183DQP9_9BILA|nr:unnamed protein product [Gongylonema pulchrum]
MSDWYNEIHWVCSADDNDVLVIVEMIVMIMITMMRRLIRSVNDNDSYTLYVSIGENNIGSDEIMTLIA